MIRVRDEDSPHIPRAEMEAMVPAARCRQCGVITWTVSLVEGVVRSHKDHTRWCDKPAGRMDLLMRLGVRERGEFMDGRLLKPMTDAELVEAEKELHLWKSRTI